MACKSNSANRRQSAALWRKNLALLACCFALGAHATFPQGAAQQARLIGVIAAIDAPAKRITLKLDAGREMTIELQDSTRLVRVAPGSQDLSAATQVALGEM